MSINRNSTYATKTTHLRMRIVTDGINQVHFHLHLQRFLNWLARRRHENLDAEAGMVYETDDVGHAQNGGIRILEKQAVLERMLELHWIIMRQKRNL